MSRAKSEAEKRRSLQPNPARPPSPVKPIPSHALRNGNSFPAQRNNSSKPARPGSKPVRPPTSTHHTIHSVTEDTTQSVTQDTIQSVTQDTTQSITENTTPKSPYDILNQPYESNLQWKDQQ